MASQRETSYTPGSSGHTSSPDAPMTKKASEAVEGAVDQARDKMKQAGDALRGTDPQAVMRNATEYAQRGGRAAYDAVLDHPIITSMLGALLAYGLYFGMRSDDSYAGQARSYVRHAQDRWNDVDWDDWQDQARDYARKARRNAGGGSIGLLPILVGAGVAYWLFSGSQPAERGHPARSTARS